MKLNIPVGVSDIEELRKRDYYYVDKTGLIFDLLKKFSGKGYTSDPPQAFWQNPCHEYAGKLSGYPQEQQRAV